MGIIFAMISSDESKESFIAYQQKIQQEFSEFKIHFLQKNHCIFGVLARDDFIAQDCLSYSDELQITICADATITNKNELLNVLDLPFEPAINSAELIHHAYLKWGADCINQLDGDFTFALYDHKNRLCFAGRDRMGIRPLYYNYQPQQIVFSSHIGCILPALTSIQVNNDYLKQVLTKPFCFGNPFSLNTMYADISKLSPAHRLIGHFNQPAVIQKYWYFGEAETTHSPSAKAAIHDFQDYLKASILKYSTPYTNIALEVSGGLDSGAVAAYTRLLNPHQKLLALSYARPVNLISATHVDRSEFHFAQAICNHLNIPLQGIDETFYEDVARMAPRLAQWLKGACEHLFAWKSYPLYSTAYAQGFPAIFSGFGGDEFVSTQASRRIYELKNNGPQWLYFYEKIRSLKPIDYYKYVRKKLRLTSSSIPQFDLSLTSVVPSDFFTPELCNWIKQNQYQEDLNESDHRLLERCYYDGKYANAFHGRLEGSYLITRYFGINYHFPLLDWRLVNYYHQLPTKYKRRHGKGRYLFKQALVGQLPKKLHTRPTKSTSTASPYVEKYTLDPESSYYEKIRKLDTEKLTDTQVNHKIFAELLTNTELVDFKLSQIFLIYYMLVMSRVKDLSLSLETSANATN